jgi:ELWxxDGT repeat protein
VSSPRGSRVSQSGIAHIAHGGAWWQRRSLARRGGEPWGRRLRLEPLEERCLLTTSVPYPTPFELVTPAGGLVYRGSTPENGFAGTDSFAYLANDGSATTAATVCLRVEWPPLVKEINTAPADSNISSPVEVGSLLFFVATDALHGAELWRTDGTPGGTFLVTDIYPGSNAASIG